MLPPPWLVVMVVVVVVVVDVGLLDEAQARLSGLRGGGEGGGEGDLLLDRFAARNRRADRMGAPTWDWRWLPVLLRGPPTADSATWPAMSVRECATRAAPGRSCGLGSSGFSDVSGRRTSSRLSSSLLSPPPLVSLPPSPFSLGNSPLLVDAALSLVGFFFPAPRLQSTARSPGSAGSRGAVCRDKPFGDFGGPNRLPVCVCVCV